MSVPAGITHLPAMNGMSTWPTNLGPYLMVVHKALAAICAARATRAKPIVARRRLSRSRAQVTVRSQLTRHKLNRVGPSGDQSGHDCILYQVPDTIGSTPAQVGE
jgi:hypothetical protein